MRVHHSVTKPSIFVKRRKAEDCLKTHRTTGASDLMKGLFFYIFKNIAFSSIRFKKIDIYFLYFVCLPFHLHLFTPKKVTFLPNEDKI